MHALFRIPLLALLIAPSCSKKQAAGPPQMPPAAVTVQPALTETVRITRELPGRIEAFRTSEVRARVAGILLEKSYREGSNVKADDLLFRIDPSPFEAARDSALASLARAEAASHRAVQLFDRYDALVASKAISGKDYDDADSGVKVAAAEVKVAAAALKTAELNLSYATVTAPIAGRAGKARVTEGALVGQNEATLLTVIQQLDPIYFDFTQSSTDLIALKRALESGELSAPEEAPATLLLDDGSEYPHPGKILFSEAAVDQSTGMTSLRAEFPNPDRLLLPGMFARALIIEAVRKDTVTVPQRAVTRIQNGKASVLVVDDSDHAELRIIETGDAVGDRWIINSGLKAGERVIMSGHLKVRPGAAVVPEPFIPSDSKDKESEGISQNG